MAGARSPCKRPTSALIFREVFRASNAASKAITPSATSASAITVVAAAVTCALVMMASYAGCEASARKRQHAERQRPHASHALHPSHALAFILARSSHALLGLHNLLMTALQFVVEGGHTLSGTIRPSGNKNAALPIISGALLTEHPVTLENVPRIRDVETLVELVSSAGVDVVWSGQNALQIHAKTVKAAQLDPA